MAPRFRFNNPNLVRQYQVLARDYPELHVALESITEQGCCPETIWGDPELFRQYDEAGKRFPELVNWFTRLLDSAAITGASISDTDPGNWLSGQEHGLKDLRPSSQIAAMRASSGDLRTPFLPESDEITFEDPWLRHWYQTQDRPLGDHEYPSPKIRTPQAERLPDGFVFHEDIEELDGTYQYPEYPSIGTGGLLPPWLTRTPCGNNNRSAQLRGTEFYENPSSLPGDGNVFNVIDFGADSTGQNDSYMAIQTALYSMFRHQPEEFHGFLWGGKVHFPKGTYRVTCPLQVPGINIVKAIEKVGIGPGVLNFSYVIISLDPEATIVFDHESSSQKPRGLFELGRSAANSWGFTIFEGGGKLTQAASKENQETASTRHDGIRCNVRNVLIRDLIFEGFRGNGVAFQGYPDYVGKLEEPITKAEGQKPPKPKDIPPFGNRVVNCVISKNGGSGIRAQSGTQLVVEGCGIEDNHEYGLFFHSGNGASITNNKFKGNGTSEDPGIVSNIYADLRVAGSGVTNVSITGNLFEIAPDKYRPSVSIEAGEHPVEGAFIYKNDFIEEFQAKNYEGIGIQLGSMTGPEGVGARNTTIVDNYFSGLGTGIHIGIYADRSFIGINRWKGKKFCPKCTRIKNESGHEYQIDRQETV